MSRSGSAGRAFSGLDLVVTVVDGEGRRSDVRVRGGADARVGELADALVKAGVRVPSERDLYAGSACLAPDIALGASVLHGQVLGAGPAPAAEPSLRELRVVGGLRAGETHPLRPGPTLLGRAPGSGVVLADERVSRAHARVVVDPAGVTVADLGSTNGTLLDKRVVPETGVPWPEGARLRIGDTVLEVGLAEPPRGMPAPEAGRLGVVPPPRLRTPAPTAEVRYPEPPPPVRRTRVPLAAALAPLAVGVVAAAVLGSATFLLFALLSPVVVLAGAASDRGQARRESREAQQRHRDLVAGAVQAVAAAVTAEAEHRHASHPDCVTLRRVALHRGPRLWERRGGDDDVLRLRLGTADLPSVVRLVGGPPAVCPAVPVPVALPETGALGIAGSRQHVLASARALLASATVLHSPALLDVVVLSAVPGDWAWTRWLPHLRRCPVRDALLDDLLAAVDRHTGPPGSGPARPGEPRARTLVVVDEPRLRDCPRLRRLTSRGAAAGIHLICLAAHVGDLPPGCSAVLEDRGPEGWVLRQDEVAPVPGICPDGVSAGWAEDLARSLAPLTVASTAVGPSLPPDVSWRELEGLRLAGDTGDAGQVLDRWARPEPAVTLGVSSGGPLRLDLARTGPHCLVAGTTGSGKSELLQTLVAGLALANPPEALQLVLVDYKGGAAFGRCADLPHTAGLVTDLDPALTRRALASLSAELRRREALLLRAGVPDLAAYEQRRDRAAGQDVGELPALARLVLVVDEFATLADELPDFVRGLVAVAQRGRSLGVHLVLATQRPEGSVSQDIRANTALRLCLAVAREAESRDVLDAPDAASIGREHPGRGYLRHGADGLVLFQTARVTVPQAPEARAAPALQVEVLGPGAPGLLARPEAPRPSGGVGPTDLDLLVAACAAAAERRGVPRPAPPWLPPLPKRLLLTDLGADACLPDGDDVLVPFALQDVPREQARRVLSLDLRGNLVVVGGPRSGRTTTLVTVAGAAARRLPPDRLHLVGLDLAGTALRGLEQLPHCGVVVTGDEPERLARLVAALTREITRRRAGAGGRRAPHLLLLLDSWDGFVSSYADVDAGRLVDALTRVLREGPSVGVTAVVSSDRTALVGRVSALLPQRLLLHLPDAGDYAAAGVAPRDVPGDLPPGRGMHDSGLLTQVALLHSDTSLPPAELLARLDLPPAPPGTAEPLRVDPLPVRVTAAAAEAMRAAPRPAGRLVTPGVGGDRLRPLDVDLGESGPVILVAGPPRSGRSTALLTCLMSLLSGVPDVSRPSRVLVLAPRPGPLRTPPDLGVPVTVVTDPCGDVRGLLDQTTVLVVDDADQVTDPGGVAVLDAALTTARESGTVVLAAGTTSALLSCYRPWAEEARRGRTGLLLAPESAADGDVLGCRLPRSTGTAVAGPGRGLLVVRGEAVALQVALPAPPTTESSRRSRTGMSSAA